MQVIPFLLACSVHAMSGVLLKNVSQLGICPDSGGCSAGGVAGACVSVSGGCCSGGTWTKGLCPGSADVECCTGAPCSTPQGSGRCMQASSCSGRSIPHYCSGPADIECCVSGGGCILGTLGGCDSSGPTAGITKQIVAELNTMGYSFRAINPTYAHCANFACTLQNASANALESACASVKDFITLNSAFRSSAEQFVLYNYYLAKKCGITLAAAPGSSNHEGGRAIDTSYYAHWQPILARYGWVHTYPTTDPVHFDFTSAPNLDSQNLRAFQRLWNRHNPSVPIAEDGVYGPATEKALYNSPCGGW